MKATREEMKQEAVKMLQALQIYEPYISAFKAKKQTITMFEKFGGYYIDKDSELAIKIKEFEEKNNVVVYAVTHETTNFGELYDLLYVSNEKSEWGKPYFENGISYVYAYVWNKDEDWCSEIGEIGLAHFGGGIARRY